MKDKHVKPKKPIAAIITKALGDVNKITHGTIKIRFNDNKLMKGR